MTPKHTARAVILAAGPMESYAFFKAEPTDFVICADGGYRHAERLGLTPHILLGDFDSFSGKRPEHLKVLQFPAEKDETDLQLAMTVAIEKGYKCLWILGAMGGRVDHFLGNIGLLSWAAARDVYAVLESADTRVQLVEKTARILKRESFYLSLLPVSGDAIVSVRGVKYPAENKKFRAGDTLGISNEIVDDVAEISVHEGTILVVESRKDR